ncbi:signal peptidase I [Streptomyces sp. NPDC004959]|uniref:signal peptidase I n=1 Tax=Streptomyces sp. NPDC004959 TaxID=3154673 RepID=UPI0033BECAD7
MSASSGTAPSGSRTGNVLSGIVVALGFVLLVGGFAWGAWEYRPYAVPTPSMSPTIEAGDRVLGQRVSGDEVRRGDVVVFKDRTWGDATLVKRVVAVGGDKVACCTDGHLTVNGEPIAEPYLPTDAAHRGTRLPETAVPKGRLFLLGDERAGSLDSTAHLDDVARGSVPRSAVSARVDAVIVPWRGMLEHPSGFAGLPGGISTPGPLRLLLGAVVLGAVLILGGAAYGPLARRGARRRAARRGREAAPHAV